MKFIQSKLIILGFLMVSCTYSPENKENELVKQETRLSNYKIENQELNTALKKASFDIRLEQRISEDEIKLIAEKIKSDNAGFDRYFILYYLPDMKVGAGAWATSHFDPDLFVNIQGISDEETDEMSTTALPEGKLIGKWFDNRPYIENTMIIYEQNEILKLRQIYKDGSFGDKELQKNGNKYVYKNDFGEFIKIETDGTLGLYSENGKYATLNKVE